MKSPTGKLIIRTNKVFEDTVLAPGGTEFFVDTSGPDEDNVRIFAEVLAVPDAAGGGIAGEVMVGDRAYFNYLTLLGEPFTLDGGMAYKVDYDQVICVVRDGGIKMIGGHVLLSRIKGEVRAMEFRDEVFVEGAGVLEHIGTPIGGETLNPMPEIGDIVRFPPSITFLNRIEGKEYVVIQQEDILAVEG